MKLKELLLEGKESLRKLPRSVIIFWGLYLLLNSILFLPDYILHADTHSIFPENGLLLQDSTLISIQPGIAGNDDILQTDDPAINGVRTSMFWLRNGHDLFRLNIEVWVWVFLILLFRSYRQISRIIMLLGIPIYLFFLIYHIYYYTYTDIYAKHPMIWNDLLMAKEVLPIFLGSNYVWT